MEKGTINIHEMQDILRDDQRRFDRRVAELKKRAFSRSRRKPGGKTSQEHR